MFVLETYHQLQFYLKYQHGHGFFNFKWYGHT